MSYINRVKCEYRGLNPFLKLRHNIVFANLFGHELLANTLEYSFDFKSNLCKCKDIALMEL